jgi:RNA recognition motif-containing protein
MERQAHEINLGYAFVTYSNSDEAKLALIMAQGIFLDGMEAELLIKNKNVDHKDFDQRYSINK